MNKALLIKAGPTVWNVHKARTFKAFYLYVFYDRKVCNRSNSILSKELSPFKHWLPAMPEGQKGSRDLVGR
jgi:hypothetical protein